MNINGITIENETTFYNLISLFSGKSPSKETVLLLRLYFDGHLTKEELEILNQRIVNDVLNNKKLTFPEGISGIKVTENKISDVKPMF